MITTDSIVNYLDCTQSNEIVKETDIVFNNVPRTKTNLIDVYFESRDFLGVVPDEGNSESRPFEPDISLEHKAFLIQSPLYSGQFGRESFLKLNSLLSME